MTGPLLLYDGGCGFCNATVQLVLRHDRHGTLRFASLTGQVARDVLARHPELRGVDSLIWVDARDGEPGERIAVRSAAGLLVARYLGGVWRLALAAYLLPRPIRDRVYDWVARHRHRLPGADRCLVPPPHARERFLDD